MKKYLIIIICLFLFALAWKIGGQSTPPPLSINLDSFKVKGDIKGISTDRMPPVSRLNSTSGLLGQGDTVSGTVSDLGSGVAGVVIQIQRVQDGAVWDGKSWIDTAGSYQNAIVTGNIFRFKIPLKLILGSQYIIRSQAVDNFGNAQTKWSQITVSGKDLGQTQVN